MVDRAYLDKLRKEIPQLEAQLKLAKESLQRNESQCRHVWSEPARTSVSQVEERIDWNRPIHQGSDFWYGSTYAQVSVPAWTRTCSVCGKVEQTTNTKDQVTKVPSF